MAFSVTDERIIRERLQHIPAVGTVPLPPSLQPAAVLVPLLRRGNGWHVLLTRRAQGLSNHRGQVAFPGGARDPTDRDAVTTALRETREELGIPARLIHVLATLPDQPVISGYRVTPVVALLPPDIPLHPSPVEIARVFFVPCDWLAEPKNFEREEIHVWRGRAYPVPFYRPYKGEIIWGMTARILRTLVEVLCSRDTRQPP